MSMTRLFAILVISLVGCASGPKSVPEQQSLEQRASASLNEMMTRDPSLHQVLPTAVAYAVFPSIGKGGFIVGGAAGDGILYEHGKPVGVVKLSQASVGAQLGAQTFAELVVLRDPGEVQKLKAGQWSAGANISAVALSTGAATASQAGPVSVFVMAKGGLMVDISVNGQKINFQPLFG